MSAALETRELRRRFRHTWALDGVSVTVPRGSVVGLVGPNGAGKSTLLQIAVGLLSPTSGEVFVDGEAVAPDRPVLRRVAFVAQDKPLYRSFTVAEMLRFGRTTNPVWDDRVARDRFARLGIPLDKRVGKLSGGQQAQVALAIALGKQPELLMLDEPIANLDPLARREFLQVLMDEVARTQMTVVLSSHLVADLDRACDRLILLTHGRVRLDGEVESLIGEHRLLVGPADRADAVLRGVDVVHETRVGRQATAIVRGVAAIADPGWDARQITLEDIVLAYMQADLDEPNSATMAEGVPA
jgi:ABC-2 type transport system ATP-binding protein